MKAIVITEFGESHVFKYMEIEKPSIKPGHVLIEVKGTSVNPVDYKIRSGKIPGIVPDFPAVLHGDVAGTVVEVGEGVTEFVTGDDVFGCAGGVKGSHGALAEYMLVDAKLIAKKPKNLTMAQAAALPLVSITAYEALFEKVKVKSGDKVLVHGGAGGVGHIAIQLAKLAGADVYTTVSNDQKAELVSALGITNIIYYRKESVEEYVARVTDGKGFDIVIDAVGGRNIDASIQAAALYGHVVTIESSSQHDLSPLLLKSASLHVVFMLLPLLYNIQREQHGAILRFIAKHVEEGSLKPLIYPQTFHLDEVNQAHDLAESGKAYGKIVINF